MMSERAVENDDRTQGSEVDQQERKPGGAGNAIRGSRFDEQLATILTATILMQGWKFFASEQEIPPDQVAGPRHMLPAILWQVEKMHRIAYGGSSTGVQYAPDPESAIGVTALLPTKSNAPKSPLMLFSLEVLTRAVENYPLPHLAEGASIDHLVQDFLDDHDQGLIPWIEGVAKAPDFSGRRQAGNAGA